MSAVVTQLTISPEELAAIVRSELEKHTERMARESGEEWTLGDVCQHYNVSAPTVRRWEREGGLPKRMGRHWLKADVLRYRRERANQ